MGNDCRAAAASLARAAAVVLDIDPYLGHAGAQSELDAALDGLSARLLGLHDLHAGIPAAAVRPGQEPAALSIAAADAPLRDWAEPLPAHDRWTPGRSTLLPSDPPVAPLAPVAPGDPASCTVAAAALHEAARASERAAAACQRHEPATAAALGVRLRAIGEALQAHAWRLRRSRESARTDPAGERSRATALGISARAIAHACRH